jgi:hypothetical protein
MLLKTAVRVKGRAAALDLERATADPFLVQRRCLLELLRASAGTAFGREHGFDSIKSEADYRRRVPVRDYEGFRPYVKRIVDGERSVLTKSAPFMLTMTSGTTGEPKLIPVTRPSQRANARAMNCWFARALAAHPSFLDRKGLGIVSRAIEGETYSGLPYGSMSGLTYRNLPWLLKRIQAVPYEVFETGDYDERYFLIARYALAAELSFIATPNPSTLLRLAEVVKERAEELIRAVHEGSTGAKLGGRPEITDRLAARLMPDPERARQLERAASRAGGLRPADCWSNLRLIACWTGGSSRLQAERLADHYGLLPMRDLGYMASEGHFTVPREDSSSAGLPTLSNNYFEFIPESEGDSPRAPVLSAHELDEGSRYSILLTTPGGLYRYRIGDIVEVCGFEGRAPLLSFVRKEGEMTSITGEKMHVNHLLLALDHLKAACGLAVEQFRATPDFARGRYEIFLEPGGGAGVCAPSAVWLREEVLPELDRALCRVNMEYAQKRASRRLCAPRLHLMKPGWSSAERRRAVKAGGRDAQYKWRALCPEAQLADLSAIELTVEAEKTATGHSLAAAENAAGAGASSRALVA